MISVCIPIYNYCVQQLVSTLAGEIASLGAWDEIEIVCIDDHSTDEWRKLNDGIGDRSAYYLLDENIGRARIRNSFLEHSKGEWLLFLDNDSEIADGFLQRYRSMIDNKHDVIVGGRIYDKRGDDWQHRLRYLYGTRVESHSADERRKNPYRNFMTNNFMVRRTVLENIKFDPRLANYGHEDTLFGFRLEENHIPLLHIDNPVVNGYVETNKEFLQKTAEGIDSLSIIYDFLNGNHRFCQSVRLLDTYTKIRRLGLLKLVDILFQWRRASMERQFESGERISLHQFSFYKLGLFIEKQQMNETKKEKKKIQL